MASFDVTFHPFGAEEIDRYVFDVWRNPSLARARARELNDDGAKQEVIITTIYAQFAAWRAQLETGQVETGQLKGTKTLAFACAALSGYRHFYSYAQGSALAFAAEFAPEIANLFIPLSALPNAPPELASIDFNGGLLDTNYSASGLLPLQHFAALRCALDGLREKAESSAALFCLFDEHDREALESALAAAEGLGVGLMEAADLVVPAERTGSTDLDKLRLIRQRKQGCGPEECGPGEPQGREQFPCLCKSTSSS
ncbi:MAG: hypothetical protein JRH20_07385 [Deltaproteobacteria bacterium]|nr:hypothetical protein [Deltaproteobacteria bacterium]